MKFLNHASRCSTPSHATSSRQRDGLPSERVQTGSSAKTTGLSSTPHPHSDDIVLVYCQSCHVHDRAKPDVPDEFIDPTLKILSLYWRETSLKGVFDNFQNLVKLLI